MNDFTYFPSSSAESKKKSICKKQVQKQELGPKEKTIKFLRRFARSYHFESQLPIGLQNIILE